MAVDIDTVIEELRTLDTYSEDFGPSGGMKIIDIIAAIEQSQAKHKSLQGHCLEVTAGSAVFQGLRDKNIALKLCLEQSQQRVKELEGANDVLREANSLLQGAFGEFASHDDTCGIYDNHDCDCGFKQALSRKDGE